MRFGHSAEK